MIPMAISLMSIIEVMMDLTNKREKLRGIVFLGFCLLGDVGFMDLQVCQAYGIHHPFGIGTKVSEHQKNGVLNQK